MAKHFPIKAGILIASFLTMFAKSSARSEGLKWDGPVDLTEQSHAAVRDFSRPAPMRIAAVAVEPEAKPGNIDWHITCDESIWNAEKCAAFTASLQADPYQYLRLDANTSIPAAAIIQSKLSKGKPISKKEQELLQRENELTGYIEALRDDPRTVQVLVPPNKIPDTDPVFSGCFFFREYVQPESQQTCREFLAPLARMIYLSIREYKALCGDNRPGACGPLIQ